VSGRRPGTSTGTFGGKDALAELPVGSRNFRSGKFQKPENQKRNNFCIRTPNGMKPILLEILGITLGENIMNIYVIYPPRCGAGKLARSKTAIRYASEILR